MRILIGTSNKHKVQEISSCMSDMPVDWIPACTMGSWRGPLEDGSTYEENARIKARAYANRYGMPCLAEDSGLEVDALGAAPGLRSARYAGRNANDQENMKKLLKAMENIPPRKRTARFVCVAVLYLPSDEEFVTRGTCEGLILLKPRGMDGFGYDPIFGFHHGKNSMAELSMKAKCRISHRSQAMAAMKQIIMDVKKKWDLVHST